MDLNSVHIAFWIKDIILQFFRYFYFLWILESALRNMLALRLDCSTAALTTPQKLLSISRLVELKMLDFSDCT